MPDNATPEQLAATLRGQLLQSGDDGYDEARKIWNGMIDRRPAMIAQCSGAADVITCVNFARENQLPLSVKGGGHGVAGKAVCDDGLMIDLSRMNAVRVDPDLKTAQVQAGATLGDMDHETQAFGLATTAGIDSRTGIAGLTLGGGNGHLSRSFGLSVDNLMAADVVTAGGELVRASETENADLLWALRGGSGNFGIVTSFEFRLHRVGPEILTAQIFHPFESATEGLQFYRDFMANAPNEVACYALVLRVPPVEPFPVESHGELALAFVACHSGDIDEGHRLLGPLQKFGNPLLNVVMPMPYKVLQSAFNAATPDGARYYFKSHYLDELSDDAIETLIRSVGSLPGPLTQIAFEPMGGAVRQVDATATAFPHRSAIFNLSVFGGWFDPVQDDEIIAWIKEFHNEMEPYATGGVYVNYLDRDDSDRARAAYGSNYERLRQIKARYDPDNLFSAHQRIDTSADPEPEATSVNV